MKINIFFSILFTLNLIVLGQAKIPEVIKSDLTLRPTPKPYESTGFTVEKGATLTILPGTKIKITSIKDKDPILRINGNLVVGAAGTGKNQSVIIEGDSPAIVFRDSKIDLNNLEINAPQVLFENGTNGTIKNCKFLTGPKGVWYKVLFIVPKSGSLIVSDTLFEDKTVEISSADFPNDLDKFVLNKCAFTTKWVPANKKFKLHLLSSKAFAYGTKCDCYTNIEFRAFDWETKKKVETEWYIGDEGMRKTLDGSAKLAKTFALKLPGKPFTNHKQDEAPEEKEKKK